MMTAKIEGKGADRMLVVSCPMTPEPVVSKSGKTLVVASSHGNQPCADCTVNGHAVRIGLNAYIPK